MASKQTKPTSNTTSPTSNTSSAGASAPAEVPRPKRIACVLCRKRKLRCDGLRPSCATCSRLGHNWYKFCQMQQGWLIRGMSSTYDEVRRKSGPKRGYVKALEARLAQVETLLKDQGGDVSQGHQRTGDSLHSLSDVDTEAHGPIFGKCVSLPPATAGLNPQSGSGPEGASLGASQWPDRGIDPPLSWEMMALGMDEALPAPDIVEALDNLYFSRIHPSFPIIHKGRYYSNLELPPNLRPPPALRYAMWCQSAATSDQYSHMQSHFYQLSRKYLQDAEMRGHGENTLTIAISQAWSLISCYEFRMMYFPRAWLSTGRAVRLALMQGTHRLDGAGLEVKRCLPPPKDWLEKEERRRTFWSAFCLDRYASMGTGWPMIIDERDIMTNLPVGDEAFDSGSPAKSLSLKDALTPEGASMLSSFGGVVLMAVMFGRNLTHLHRPDGDGRDDNLNGDFWRRHRQLDSILLNISLSLPSHFRLPNGINNPNIIFTNMNIHTSTICLHQAAIFKADKNRALASVVSESKIRCITAAAEIASTMRAVCHQDLSGMNPFISFCLYVASRVFVQYLKSRPGDEQVRASLQFLLTVMGHMKKHNPLTESFLVQLDVDLSQAQNQADKVPTASSVKYAGPCSHGGSMQPMNVSKSHDRSYTEPEDEALMFHAPPNCTHMPDAKVDSRTSIDDSSEANNTHSPLSLGASDGSLNIATPPSQNQSSNNSSYSPPSYYNDYSTAAISVPMEELSDAPYQISKEMSNWDFLDMDGSDFDTAMDTSLGTQPPLENISILQHPLSPDLGDFFVHSKT